MLQNKNKNIFSIERAERMVSHLGMTVMLAATVVSMVEIAHRESSRLVATLQPAYALSGQHADLPNQIGHGDEQSRRSKEEIRHTSATYGEMRRQHVIAGTV